MSVFLETKRLILRGIERSDLEGIFELDSNPIVHKYLGNKPIKTKSEAEKSIQFIQKQYKARGVGRLVAFEKASGEFIGWSGLKLNTGRVEELNGKQDFYDIGYRLIPKFWGKGYATESSIEILRYGFDKLNIESIIGAAEVENRASNIVLQKIGLQFKNKFTYENTLCNWYELNIEDYAKKMS